jgi:hypothetical protein
MRNRSESSRRPGSGLGGAILLAFLTTACWSGVPGAAPAAAIEPTRPSDPVVRDVVELLEAGLAEPLIQRWLEDGDRHPGDLVAADLVALKDAGASDQLIAALLERAAASDSTPGSAPAPSAPTVPSPAVSPPASFVAPGLVPVTLSVRYVHGLDEEEEERGPWSFVAYVDGVPTPALGASGRTQAAPSWSGGRALAPGLHVVRWAQEREREGRGGSVLREARFDPEPLTFELAPGEPATIDVEFRDRSGIFARFGGPMEVRVTQGDRELAARETNDDPAHWPLLCEEIEASLGDREPGWDERRQLKRCLRWSELWPGPSSVPSRDEARPELR